MVRATAASLHREDDQDNSQSQGDSKTNKRRCVQSACVPCRKRKSKCDGGTPVCATCTAVYKTECHYDAESESRRSKPGSSSTPSTLRTKRDASVVTTFGSEHVNNAEFILNCLRQIPDDHVDELIQHIRTNPKLDIASLAEAWRKNVPLPPTTPVEIRSLEADLSMLFGKPAVTATGESRHFGHSASLGLVPETEDFAGGSLCRNSVVPERQGTTWTLVTHDLGFVERLLGLYFRWSHAFYVLFGRESFYQDFRNGREKYCSSLLINAICAYACHLSDEPAARTDPSDSRTAGNHFFAEAKRLLFQDETPSLTTTQALCIMALREPSAGRDSSGFSYIGRCMRMCVELGLHLNTGAGPELRLTPTEIEIRKVTFWGCFTVDTVWSVCVGRIAQLPRAAITLDKPMLDETATLLEAFPGRSRSPSNAMGTRIFLQEFAALSELVNDNNYMFFAPKERLTSAKLLDCYNKYQAWYRRLPLALLVEGKNGREPHVLVLHMLYYTIIVHLFRPMLKVDLTQSELRPRDICIDAANDVSRLIRIYRSHHDFRTAHLLITHMLLSVCIVHLLYSQDNSTSRQNLVEGLQGLEDIHECHYFGARGFRILYSLAETWNLPWPAELADSRLLPKRNPDIGSTKIESPADLVLITPNTAGINTSRVGSNMPYPTHGHPHRRASLSMYGTGHLQLATHAAPSRPSSVVSGQHYQSPVINHTPTQNTFNPTVNPSPFQYPQSIAPVPANVSTTSPTPARDGTETMFWNPIPGMPGPILPPQHSYPQVGPMGLKTVLRSPDTGDQLGRDGFKLNEEWRSGQVNGFDTHAATATFGVQGEQNAAGYIHRVESTYVPAAAVVYPQAPHEGHHATPQEHFNSPWWEGANGHPNHMN